MALTLPLLSLAWSQLDSFSQGLHPDTLLKHTRPDSPGHTPRRAQSARTGSLEEPSGRRARPALWPGRSGAKELEGYFLSKAAKCACPPSARHTGSSSTPSPHRRSPGRKSRRPGAPCTGSPCSSAGSWHRCALWASRIRRSPGAAGNTGPCGSCRNSLPALPATKFGKTRPDRQSRRRKPAHTGPTCLPRRVKESLQHTSASCTVTPACLLPARRNRAWGLMGGACRARGWARRDKGWTRARGAHPTEPPSQASTQLPGMSE